MTLGNITSRWTDGRSAAPVSAGVMQPDPRAMPKKPYSQRSDLERVESNWIKTLGLFARREYSLSIVRAAVTAELALNYVIRQELLGRHRLPSTFVDKHLKWANGIRGKLDRLYLPIVEGTKLEGRAKTTAKALETLNDQRNAIAHRGEFREKQTAQKCLELAEKEITSLITEYDKAFCLQKFDPASTYERVALIPGVGFVQMPRQPEVDEK